MKTRSAVIIIIALILFIPESLFADTVYFNNGGTIEGIIKNEDKSGIELDIGFGTIRCGMGEIKKIERSSNAEHKALTNKWDKKREELKASEEEFSRERRKRFDEYDKWLREERERKDAEEANRGAIDVRRDLTTHSILVDTVLNDKVAATLVLDTGASIVVLTRRKGEELGLDLTTSGDIATLNLAGGRTVTAKMVILKSVRINDIEVKNVLTGVLLDDGGVAFTDGLLGMTFLSRFNLKIDLKNMKISLEKPA
ncbi:MAG: retropepsin-like aspartic protease [Candidatus Omnitrophica bacterium]|nr:retropepsin-like aspartic protease [Candidatus Omnitrophota bacterium]MDD5436336.1 retropepsin-like aspartic protease [Candidatus Omnitrophota bacterium]